MITIKTRLNDGIYRSCGGGQEVTHYEWTTGPRNVLKAIDTLSSHRHDMIQSFGNIGCGHSWLEIDGKAVHAYDMDYVSENYEQPDHRGQSRTERAKAMIDEVKAGKYDSTKYDYPDDEEV